MAALSFFATPVDVWNLEPGDVYLWGSPRETREVLGIIQRGPNHSMLLEVRKASGDVVRSTVCGSVELLPHTVTRDRTARYPGELRAALAAGARTRKGSEIIAARVLAAAHI